MIRKSRFLKPIFGVQVSVCVHACVRVEALRINEFVFIFIFVKNEEGKRNEKPKRRGRKKKVRGKRKSFRRPMVIGNPLTIYIGKSGQLSTVTMVNHDG